MPAAPAELEAVTAPSHGETNVAVKRSEATEDYLKAIYSLAEENDQVIAARVAEDIGVTPSTMFSALRRLEKEELVRVERRKNIFLTSKGREVAEAILRRHFLTERLLTDLLGLDWVTAHQEAHHLEHAISPVVEERLAAILDNPSTCPHGNPIPVKGEASPRREWIPLNTAEVGSEVVFRCITETGERDERLLSFLYDHNVHPGVKIEIRDIAPSLGTISLRVGKDEVVLGLEAAKKIYVQ